MASLVKGMNLFGFVGKAAFWSPLVAAHPIMEGLVAAFALFFAALTQFAAMRGK